ncbi:MAG: hypothetical protein ABI723_00795 [Bacteroidia bacterium]
MKKILIIQLLILFTLKTNAQLSAVDYSSDEFTRFKASKTYIVRTGDAAFDKELESAAKELWTVTKIDFLDNKDLDAKISDKTASFLLSVIIGTGTSHQDYHYLALVNGGVKKVTKYGYDDMLAYCPINHFADEKENTDCAFRVRNMLQSMIDAMAIVQKNDIKGNSKKIVDGLQKVYNTKSSKIKDRTLLFCQEAIGTKLKQSDIAAVYPYKFEICKRSKIEQAIKDKSKEYYYYQPAITLNKSMFVFDPATGEVLYFDYAMQGMTINKGNIEDLVEGIKGGKK